MHIAPSHRPARWTIRRRPRLAVGAVLVLFLVIALAAATPASAAVVRRDPPRIQVGSSLTMRRDTTTPAPTATVGLLGPTNAQLASLAGSAVRTVVLPIGWDLVEPAQGVYDTEVLRRFASNVADLRRAGLQVVLDLGLQYPPDWVFDLPGATRFVNQYGDVWHGATGEDVPNAVFDPAIRAAQSDYITHLAAGLGPDTFTAIRIGGLLSGELRYPNGDYNGHTDSLWDYDPAAQLSAPYPGWAPGAGSTKQSRASVRYYFDSLTSYLSWQLRTVNTAFPGVNQQVMLPGWGMRPGMLDAAVSTGVTGRSLAEASGTLSAGLDWAGQVAAISASGVHATVYTTWLDAPAQDTTGQGEPPVDYLDGLAKRFRLPLAGENTGGGGIAALKLCVQRAKNDHLTSFMYMSGPMIENGSAGITVPDLVAAANSMSSNAVTVLRAAR